MGRYMIVIAFVAPDQGRTKGKTQMQLRVYMVGSHYDKLSFKDERDLDNYR